MIKGLRVTTPLVLGLFIGACVEGPAGLATFVIAVSGICAIVAAALVCFIVAETRNNKSVWWSFPIWVLAFFVMFFIGMMALGGVMLNRE